MYAVISFVIRLPTSERTLSRVNSGRGVGLLAGEGIDEVDGGDEDLSAWFREVEHPARKATKRKRSGASLSIITLL